MESLQYLIRFQGGISFAAFISFIHSFLMKCCFVMSFCFTPPLSDALEGLYW